jgi:hypothetical protein
MNYNELTREEATRRLREHDEADWSDDRLWDEVIEPRDVLYWLDAFGDQSLAINCQPLPKDLPDDVVKEINEYDVLNDWQGEVRETSCPVCQTEFYEFDWKYDCLHISEYGDVHEYVEFISNPAGYYWDSTGEHHLMCQSCREPPKFSRMRPKPTSNEVRVFYGESDEFSRFSHTSGVVRWDFEWDMDYGKSTDLFNLRAKDDGELISGSQIAAAFAGGHSSRDAMMGRLGFKRIHVKEIDQSVKGIRRFWRYAKEVLESWATLDSKTMTEEPTHPDLNFTYIIEGEYQAWVPEEHAEKFEAELVYQSLKKANDYDRATQYRKENADLLVLDYKFA